MKTGGFSDEDVSRQSEQGFLKIDVQDWIFGVFEKVLLCL